MPAEAAHLSADSPRVQMLIAAGFSEEQATNAKAEYEKGKSNGDIGPAVEAAADELPPPPMKAVTFHQRADGTTVIRSVPWSTTRPARATRQPRRRARRGARPRSVRTASRSNRTRGPDDADGGESSDGDEPSAALRRYEDVEREARSRLRGFWRRRANRTGRRASCGHQACLDDVLGGAA